MKEQLRLSLEEDRRINDNLLHSADALDGKATTVFGSGSLVLTIVVSLQVGAPDHQPRYWTALALALGLYIVMTAIFLVAIRPRPFKTPITGERADLEREILLVSEKKAALAVLGGYEEAIRHNQKLTEFKGWLLTAGLGVLALIVASLVAMAFLV